ETIIEAFGIKVSMLQLQRASWATLARLLITIGLRHHSSIAEHGGVRQELEILAKDASDLVRDTALPGLSAAHRSKLSDPDPRIRREAVASLSFMAEEAGRGARAPPRPPPD